MKLIIGPGLNNKPECKITTPPLQHVVYKRKNSYVSEWIYEPIPVF